MGKLNIAQALGPDRAAEFTQRKHKKRTRVHLSRYLLVRVVHASQRIDHGLVKWLTPQLLHNTRA